MYTPRTQSPTAPGSQFSEGLGGGDSPPSSLPPSPWHKGLYLYSPLGPGSSAQTPGLGCEVGEGRGGGGGSSERDTKRRPSASAPWRRWGGGSVHPVLPSPPAGLGTSAATHLGPAYLGWGRGDAAAGGLGAVSVSVRPARGGSGRHNHRLGCKGRREGLGRPSPGALRGAPRPPAGEG